MRALGLSLALALLGGCGAAEKKEEGGSITLEARVDKVSGGKYAATDCVSGSMLATASKEVTVVLEGDGPTAEAPLTFFSDEDCKTKITELVIPKDSGAVSFYVLSTVGGDANILFYPQGETRKASLPLSFATMTLKLEVLDSTARGKQATGSCAKVNVSLADTDGKSFVVHGDRVVKFTAKGDVFSDDECKTAVTSLTLTSAKIPSVYVTKAEAGDVKIEAYLEAFEEVTGALTVSFE